MNGKYFILTDIKFCSLLLEGVWHELSVWDVLDNSISKVIPWPRKNCLLWSNKLRGQAMERCLFCGDRHGAVPFPTTIWPACMAEKLKLQWSPKTDPGCVIFRFPQNNELFSVCRFFPLEWLLSWRMRLQPKKKTKVFLLYAGDTTQGEKHERKMQITGVSWVPCCV